MELSWPAWYTQDLNKPNTKKTSNPIKDWDMELSKELLKEDTQMAEKYLFQR